MTHFTLSESRRTLLGYGTLLLFSCAIGLMTYYTPKLQEDLEFGASNWQFIEGLTDSINWQGIWDDIVFHYTHTNGRLGDRLVIPLVCLVPQAVFAFMCAVVSLLLVKGMIRLCHTSLHDKPQSVFLVVTMLLAWYPWNESLFLASYSVNYLWTACLATWVAYMFCDMRWTEKHSWVTLAGAGTLCAIAGTWHECIFLTVGTGLMAFTLTAGQKFRTCRIVFLFAMFAGFMVNFFSGGQQTRIDGTALIFDFHHLISVRHGIPLPSWPVMPVAVYYLALCVAFISEYINRPAPKRHISHGLLDILRNGIRTTYGIHVMCLTVTLSGMFVFGFIGEARSMITGDIFAIIGLVNLYATLRKTFWHWINRLLSVAIAVVGITLFINLYVTVLFQRQIYRTFSSLKSQWLSSDTGVVFENLPPAPLNVNYPWQLTINDMYTSPWKHYYLANFLRPESTPKNFIIIPNDLKNATDADIECIDSIKGIYHIDKYLLYSNPKGYDLSVNPANHQSCFGKIIIDAITGNGKCSRIYGLIMPFRTTKTVNTYYYIWQNASNYELPPVPQRISSIKIFPPEQEWAYVATNYNR